MAMRTGEKFKRGTRVFVSGFGKGTVTDDYWRGRDRFQVRLDKTGGCHDFGEGVMTEISSVLSVHSSRNDGVTPTISELENILERGTNRPVKILPDGSVVDADRGGDEK